MIKNIVFDIGMVLIDFAWEAAMKDLGFDEECIRTLDENLINDPIWDQFDLGILPEEKVVDMVVEKIPKYEKEIRLFWENNLLTVRPYDYSEKWIKSLKSRGLKTYLLTNYPDTLFDKSVRTSFPFYPLVDGEVVSSRVKVIKPDERIYKILLERYDLVPEECIFFDDRIKNINAAKKLGFNAFVFEGYEKACRQIEETIEALK